MDRFTKVYELNMDGIKFYVRECACMEPLLYIEDGLNGHLYHRDGFNWDKSIRVKLGKDIVQNINSAFDKCQQYLDKNPSPWEDNQDLIFYKEYWDGPMSSFLSENKSVNEMKE